MATKPVIKDLGLSFGSLSKRSVTRRGVQHHMEAQGGAADCHRWHKERGWSGIGYHFVVRKDGTIEQGRPMGTVGAHAQGANSDTVGVSCEGRYGIEKSMPNAQFASLVALWWWLFGQYKLTTAKLFRHKDVGDTDCPGKYFPFDRLKKALDGKGSVIGYIVKSTRYLYPTYKAEKAKRIKKLPKGTVVLYEGELHGAWRKVKTLDGKTGWVKRSLSGVTVIKAIRDGKA